jgi:hypothetical protein
MDVYVGTQSMMLVRAVCLFPRMSPPHSDTPIDERIIVIPRSRCILASTGSPHTQSWYYIDIPGSHGHITFNAQFTMNLEHSKAVIFTGQGLLTLEPCSTTYMTWLSPLLHGYSAADRCPPSQFPEVSILPHNLVHGRCGSGVPVNGLALVEMV